MTQAKQLEDHMKALKTFYFEVDMPWYAKGGILFGPNEKKLVKVEATCKVDAIIRVLKQSGLDVTEENSERVTEITKEQYDILMLDRDVHRLNAELHELFNRSRTARRVSFASLIVGSTSLVVSIGILIAASLVENGVL